MNPAPNDMHSLRFIGLVLATVAATLSVGCSSDERVGRMELTALGPTPLVFKRDFVVGAYAARESEDSFWFSDVPLDALIEAADKGELKNATIMHAQLIWRPRAGLTPLDPTATNMVTRVLIVSEGEVGLYGGAGFALLDGTVGDERVEFAIDGASLSLLEKTSGFNDLLSPAGLSGSFSAGLAPADTARWRRALSQFATNSFGKSMWVDSAEPRGAKTRFVTPTAVALLTTNAALQAPEATSPSAR